MAGRNCIPGAGAGPQGPCRLREQFRKILNENPIGIHPEGQYVPDKALEELMTRDVIRRALGQSADSVLTAFIFQKAKRTFATVVLVYSNLQSRVQAIERFRKTKFTDDVLAATIADVPAKALEMCESQDCERLNLHCAHHFPHDMPWDTMDLSDFKTKRWHFLVHKFDHQVFQYELNCLQLLPFIKKEPLDGPNNGNFSEVSRVRMLTTRQNKDEATTSEMSVALKTLRRITDRNYDIDKEWRREAHAYKQLNSANPHLIQGISAYRQIAADPQNDTYHLILEWANGGSLQSFWEKFPNPQVDGDIEGSRRRVLKILEQLKGLVGALQCMHMSSGKSTRPGRRDSTQISPEQSPERGTSRGVASRDPPSAPQDMPSFEIQGPADLDSDASQIHSVIISPSYSSELNVPTSQRRYTNDTSNNWRHTDIKPENILRFISSHDKACIGTLKLADLGRAQQHILKTELRSTKESEPWRTRWYEPPDLAEEQHERAQWKISRLFDIWSIGCVIFETVLWILYGFDSIKQFQDANDLTSCEQSATPYWTKKAHGIYGVSDTAVTWMDHILQHDPECNGAIGTLIRLVKERLLVVDLPPNSEIHTPGFRTNALDLKDQISLIIEKAGTDKRFLFSGTDRSSVNTPVLLKANTKPTLQSSFGSSLSPRDAERLNRATDRGQATKIAQQRVYTNRLDDQWRPFEDSSFTMEHISDCKEVSNENSLKCESCEQINVLSSTLTFELANLKNNTEGEDCDLCKYIYSIVKEKKIGHGDMVTVERMGDSFVVRGTEKVLRLCRIGSEHESGLEDVPIGKPQLIEPPRTLPKSSFMKLPKAWLRECDNGHRKNCAPKHPHRQLPKRLISVRNPRKLCIIEPTELDLDPQNIRYIAFSHKWGNMPENAVTTESNLEQRKKRLLLGDLPQNFLDVIAVTIALDIAYIWVDSLCIKQGKNGDFAEQADTMQDIFANAYCVIAASDAENSEEGFLYRRKPAESFKFGNIYLSTLTNDFERDVLQSPLNRRGWVLQERALAPRTIFFTRNQMYWECGDGVRCETLANLRNDEVAFLGDPNFSDYTIRTNSTIGEQIHLFTRLFQLYSKLEFSHPEDRPIAIDGLMDRLTTAFKTKSLAGLFLAFWGRCLLWKRAGPEALKKIPFGTHTKRTPPSWSWMAFSGEISFLEPEGGAVEWNDNGITLPFAKRIQTSWLKTSNRRESNAIQAQVYNLMIDASALTDGGAYLSIDNGQELSLDDTKCILIGTEKQKDTDRYKKRHYVVLVASMKQANGTSVYKRTGVGHLLGKFIQFSYSFPTSIE